MQVTISNSPQFSNTLSQNHFTLLKKISVNSKLGTMILIQDTHKMDKQYTHERAVE